MTTKRNLVPLLGIAFVVAIAATGIFYGLFVGRLRDESTKAVGRPILVAARNLDRGTILKDTDLKTATWAAKELPEGALSAPEQAAGKTLYAQVQANEPLTISKLATKDSAGGLKIPSGMRVLSVKVFDSAGVLALLRSGHRVDVQVFAHRNGQEPEVRTFQQNLEVFSVDNAEPGNRGGMPVVSLLATPAEADRLALADSAARVRLLLRNPLDAEHPARGTVTVSSLMSGAAPPVLAARSAQKPGIPPVALGRVQIEVKVAEVGAAAFEELHRRAAGAGRGDSLQVIPLTPGREAEQAVTSMAADGRLEVLSATRLTTGNSREVSLHAGAQGAAPNQTCSLNIHLLPSFSGHGTLRLRVRPEITAPRPGGTASRRMETELEIRDGQSFLVTGLADPEQTELLAERLFNRKGLSGSTRQLVVIVKPQLIAPVTSAALVARD
jgi:pilus assembly protein CpaB